MNTLRRLSTSWNCCRRECIVERISGEAPPDYLVRPGLVPGQAGAEAGYRRRIGRRDTWQGRQLEAGLGRELLLRAPSVDYREAMGSEWTRWPPVAQAQCRKASARASAGGKSGHRTDTVMGNAHRPRGQGKCNRK